MSEDARARLRNLVEKQIDGEAERIRLSAIIDAVVAQVQADPELAREVIREAIRSALLSRSYGL